MDSPTFLSFNYKRRFGGEIEVNALDSRDFQARPLNTERKEQPLGIDYVGEVVRRTVGSSVDLFKWHASHNNEKWLIKPDSSCGMEICSPPLRGWGGLKQIVGVVDAISGDKKIPIDDRCSFHLHLDVNDLNQTQVGAVLAYWIKSEAVFLDSIPGRRKRSRYCQCIGATDLVSHDESISTPDLVKKLGKYKYLSLNTFHMNKGNRKTIEVRIIGSEGCRDGFLVKNWTRLIVHFVHMASKAPYPSKYNSKNPFTGFAWLDPIHFMELIGFLNPRYVLSSGLEQTRNWFVARLYANTLDELPGIWSKNARMVAYKQVEHIIGLLGLDIHNMDRYLNPPNKKAALYSNNERI